jgi:hypothetical protein
VSQVLRREEKLAVGGNRVALVGAGSGRITPAPRSESAGGVVGDVRVRSLPTVAA